MGDGLPIFAPLRPNRPTEEVVPLRVQPYHSVLPSAHVHHNNNRCEVGNNIEKKYLRQGTAGRPLCHRCAQL